MNRHIAIIEILDNLFIICFINKKKAEPFDAYLVPKATAKWPTQ